MGRTIALILALLAALPLIRAGVRTPEPALADAPPLAFSAGRALQDVRRVAPAPHPAGSAANRAVRDALIARMAALGLSPRLRRDDVLLALPGGGLEGGSPETLVGLLPGRDPGLPALALMAHYDSAPGAPGAADDGAGVAAVLEVVRALKAGGVPARDVAVILTDGEEAGLLGARGVFAADPLARRLGFVLNLEARGSGGRALMFQTGRDNGGDIALFRRTAARPLAGSLFGEVYARLPNDTDFTLARDAGLAGFNYAFAGRAFDYHAPTDTVANLEAGALQDIGDQVLAAARAAAFSRGLPPRRADAVYGVLPGGQVLAYSPAWGWLPLALSAGLLALAGRRARRAGLLSWRETLQGGAAAAYTLVAAGAALHLAGLAAGHDPLSPLRLLAQAPRWEAAQLCLAAGLLIFAAAETARGRRGPALILAAAAGLGACLASGGLDVAGLALGAAAAVLALLAGGGATGRPAGWFGVLALGLLVATAAQVAAPQAAYVLAWPLLLGAVGAAATRLGADLRFTRLAALAVLTAPVFAWAGVHAHLIFVAAGAPELMVLPLFIAALVAWPLMQPAPGAWPERAAGLALMAVAAALVADLRLANPWDARHPQPAFVAYHLDQDAGRAWAIARTELRTGWSDGVLKQGGGPVTRHRHWAWPHPVDAAPAQPARIAPPTLTATPHGPGDVVLTVAAGEAHALTLEIRPSAAARLSRVGQAAADAPLPAGRWTRIHWTASPPEGLRLVLRTAPGPGALEVRYLQAFERWPADLAPPPAPPAAVMAMGLSGHSFVTGTRRFAW